MALLQDLIKQIDDETLKQRIMVEVGKLTKQKKFGLVFEEHLPECTPLYDMEIRRDSKVALKNGQISDIYIVNSIDGDKAICEHKIDHTQAEFALDELVAIAEFGEPIYPYLKPIDAVCNAPNSDLWHTLIEADNYHALQLLEYLYAGKVDCIYIDPPYNTGARDWKYNNDYVDGSDAYRHSKWLSFMEKRLHIAKKLLNPKTGVLIVTIDEHEVHHLRVLLEEIFADYYIQMTTDVINPKGVTQGRFSRVEEYNIFCFAPEAFVADSEDNLLNPPDKKKIPRWKGLLRSGTDAQREDRENMFYPVLIDTELGKVVGVGQSLPLPQVPNLEEKIDGYATAWPIRKDGSYGRWSVGAETLRELIDKGYVSCGKFDSSRKTWGISYISQPNQKLIEEGRIVITGRDPKTNVVSVEYASDNNRVIKTVWHRTSHDAGAYGTDLITEIIGQTNAFSFPKSLYATHDSIASIVRRKKDALILDFFAGSGTTLNAINLLNYEDGGSRRCILITNNEVSDSDAKELIKYGNVPGTQIWENHGICRSVTWPRTKYSILGVHSDGTPLQKDYITTRTIEDEAERSIKQIRFNPEQIVDIKIRKDIVSLLGKDKLPQSLVKPGIDFVVSEKYNATILFSPSAYEEWIAALDGQDHVTELYVVTTSNKEFKKIKEQLIEAMGAIAVSKIEKISMAVGFKANAAYFKLGFLDKASVRIGRQFREMLPILWMKAGCFGPCPSLIDQKIPEYMIFPENRIAILNDNSCFAEFAEEVRNTSKIETVYLVTDSDADYRSMSKELNVKQTYQLYRDYLDNFRINSRR
ncbi:site-specific DNA-methyltransferase [Clostridium sp. AM34-11AC]|uniref:site-specific DNA-methyltransferase n=1 Tax=Clostridium sp. AM34-11AC TaxID=2305242 RepID=UPI000E403019|nr:DNA methyltransferase [Clostridium sp. AM34-11AC]RGE05401.1 site-specific DNA-methyltransferase [Clostridium sp. AM34-11AC]